MYVLSIFDRRRREHGIAMARGAQAAARAKSDCRAGAQHPPDRARILTSPAFKCYPYRVAQTAANLFSNTC